MKEVWNRWLARFAGLKQRERALIVASCLAVVLVLGFQLVLQPQIGQRARFHQQIAQQQTDSRALQEQIQVLNLKRKDPDAVIHAELADARRQLHAVNDQFRHLQQALVTPQEMARVLEELLQHNHGLQLKSLRTLPMVSVSDMLPGKAEKTDKTVVEPAKDKRDAWLYRHAVQITVQGSYTDMLAYLSELEHLPRRVYWGELTLNAEAYPMSVITVTLYTISLEKTWLMV
jgi:MSHA biogenesis protein MshJ